MTGEIRSKIFLFFGVIVVVAACSGTCFSQTCQNKFPSGSSYRPEDGWKIESVDRVGDQLVVLVCRDDAPNASPAQRSAKTATCPNPSAQPTVTEAEARRQKQEETAQRRRNKVGGLGKWDQLVPSFRIRIELVDYISASSIYLCSPKRLFKLAAQRPN